MNEFSDDIVLGIASYCEAGDLFRLALACKRFGGADGAARESLMEQAARGLLLDAAKSDAGVKVDAYMDWLRLMRRVVAKSGEAMGETSAVVLRDGRWTRWLDEHARDVEYEEEELSWIGLHHELDLIRKFRPMQMRLSDLLGGEEQFQSYLERLEDPNNPVTKVSIYGPTYDIDMFPPDEEREGDPEFVQEERIHTVFQALSRLPSLQEIAIDVGYYQTEEGGDLASSHLCWLLSPESRYRTLRVAGVDVQNQDDVDLLAEAFASCTSLEALIIDPISINDAISVNGLNVATVAPLMESIASLPKLKRLRLMFDVPVNTGRFVNESLPILRRSLRGVSVKTGGYGQEHPEVSNCTDISISAFMRSPGDSGDELEIT